MDPTTFFVDLVRVETRLYNLVDDQIRAAHDGLTVGRLQILRVIADVPGCRVSDVVADIDITVGAASKAVDRLEADGLCRRRANPHDRRSSVLELTAEGQRVLPAAWDTLAQAVTRLTRDAVPAADLQHAARTLTTLRAALEHAASASRGA